MRTPDDPASIERERGDNHDKMLACCDESGRLQCQISVQVASHMTVLTADLCRDPELNGCGAPFHRAHRGRLATDMPDTLVRSWHMFPVVHRISPNVSQIWIWGGVKDKRAESTYFASSASQASCVCQ